MPFEAVGLLDAKTFPGIGTYFKTVEKVYLSPITPDLHVLSRINYDATAPLSFAAMARAVVQDVPDDSSIVVYCHGTRDALFIPIVRSAPKNKLEMEEAIRLYKHLDDAEKNPGKTYDVPFLKLAKQEHAEELIDYLILSREKRIKTLTFLACNMGQNLLLLHALGRIFNAELVCAPKRRTGFIATDKYVFRKKPGELEAFKEAFDKLQHGVQEAHKYMLPSGPLAFVVEDIGHAKFNMKFFYAANEKVLDEFLRDYAGYPPGFTMGFTEAEATDTSKLSRVNKAIVLHGMWDGQKFIWPKEKEYQSYMNSVRLRPLPKPPVPSPIVVKAAENQPQARVRGFIRGLLRRRDPK